MRTQKIHAWIEVTRLERLARMRSDLEAFFRSEKELAISPDWVIHDSEWLGFCCPIDIDSVTIDGYQLRGSAMLHTPDRHIALQLEHHPPTDAGGAMCRIDWKPMNSHNNKGLGPVEWRFKDLHCSHFHCFDLNWKHSERAVRRGNLPIDIPIDPDPPNFREFLDFAGKTFRIRNIQRISEPPWQPLIV